MVKKRRRKKGSPLGGERLLPTLPTGKGDRYEALRFAAQSRFLDAVAEHCPHVLASLWSDVFEPIESRGWDELEERIDAWMHRYNFRKVTTRTAQPDLLRCKVCPTWFHHAARITFGEWDDKLRSSKNLRPEKLEFFYGQDARGNPIGPTVEKPRYSRDKVLAGTLDEERMQPPGPFGIPSAFVPPFAFNFPAFEPFEERAADWKQRCKRNFEEAVAKHLAERDPGGVKTPRMIEPDHFQWAALAVCGISDDGTVGWTYSRIREFAGRSSVSAVHAAVQAVLDLIGIRIVRSRGRRRGVREETPRHVAERVPRNVQEKAPRRVPGS